MNLFWTEQEKALLLEALENFGSANINAIAEMIPSKSCTEVERVIRLYERAAIRSLKADDALKNQRTAPIDRWIEFFRDNSLDKFASRDIVTALRFVGLFEERKDENLTLFYEYLADLMTGAAPRQLPNDAMQILMTYFENLCTMVKKENTSKELGYIENLELSNILQKTYLSKKGNIVGDPNLNVLKIPLNLLKMDSLLDREL